MNLGGLSAVMNGGSVEARYPDRIDRRPGVASPP